MSSSENGESMHVQHRFHPLRGLSTFLVDALVTDSLIYREACKTHQGKGKLPSCSCFKSISGIFVDEDEDSRV